MHIDKLFSYYVVEMTLQICDLTFPLNLLQCYTWNFPTSVPTLSTSYKQNFQTTRLINESSSGPRTKLSFFLIIVPTFLSLFLQSPHNKNVLSSLNSLFFIIVLLIKYLDQMFIRDYLQKKRFCLIVKLNISLNFYIKLLSSFFDHEHLNI